jgi:hypothetical protein
MSKEFVGTYLFLDNMYKNADLQRKQAEIERLRGEANQSGNKHTGAIPVIPGMVNKADYELMAEKVKFYETILQQPLEVIAEKLADKVPAFKENYEKEQVVLADWIVSQKAFKETAMKYGEMAGKSPEDIQKEGIKNENTILNDESKFGNKVNLDPEIKEKLKEKLKN